MNMEGVMPTKAQRAKEQRAKEQRAKEQRAKEQLAKEQLAKEQLAKEQLAKEQLAKEQLENRNKNQKDGATNNNSGDLPNEATARSRHAAGGSGRLTEPSSSRFAVANAVAGLLQAYMTQMGKSANDIKKHGNEPILEFSDANAARSFFEEYAAKVRAKGSANVETFLCVELDPHGDAKNNFKFLAQDGTLYQGSKQEIIQSLESQSSTNPVASEALTRFQRDTQHLSFDTTSKFQQLRQVAQDQRGTVTTQQKTRNEPEENAGGNNPRLTT
jgi:hypothetical protein